MSKLSKAQHKVLEALAADLENRWIRSDSSFRHRAPRLEGAGGAHGTHLDVHSNTLFALRKRGYIELFEREKAPWWARDYRITEAGLEAVKGDER